MTGKLGPDAFEYYLSLGAERSYQAVAEKFGVSKRAVTSLAVRKRWQERLAELEEKARRGAEQKTLETLEAMNVRHLKALRVIQAKALQALKEMSLSSAMEAVRALDLAIRQERTVRGEPSERAALSIEDVVRREYARWMTHDDGDAETEADEET
ncbi:MAG: hypothetical protein ACYSX0_13695 [Planctomycetota bacterium]|jgi:hypothetical protein